MIFPKHAPADQLRHAPGQDWLRHLGLLSDYLRIPYANGSTFATRAMYREMIRRGHRVTVVGPADPGARDEELPRHAVSLPSLPLRNHPGVYLPMPTPRDLSRVAERRFDLVLAQATTEILDLGVWLRWTQHVPFVCVNTLHLPTAYNVLLPDRLLNTAAVNDWFAESLVPWVERRTAELYNQTDGLVVLSDGMRSYWRSRGVTVPIQVIERAVDPELFGEQSTRDPFEPQAVRGARLLTVCRHGREKSLDRLLGIFAQQVRPACASATLTLVGEGPEHDNLRALAEQLGIAEQCVFVGEAPLSDVVRYLRHADVFLYSSLSETYGQVVSEAQWCGLPVVAFADGMGVSQQVQHGHSGLLVDPGPDAASADARFGAHVVRLLGSPEERRGVGERARAVARRRSDPERSLARYYDVFEQAREHCQQTAEERIKSPERAYGAIGRWLAIQSVTAGLGLLRPPVKLNRHNRTQPHWDANLEPYSTESARVSSSSLWRSTSYSRSILARA